MQAILSQFSKTNKVSIYSYENDKDNAIFSGLQEMDGDEEVEPDIDNDAGDEINSAVEASDNAMMDQLI